MEALNIFWRNVKWRFQNPETIIMTLMQPLIWLLLFSTMFATNAINNGSGGSYTAFVLPGILVMVVLTSAGMSGIANYSLKTGGSFYRIYISPVKRSSIVLGQILDAAVLTFLEVSILLVLSSLLSVRIISGILGLILILLLIFLTVFFVASLSYAISIVFKNENSFLALVNMLILPLFFVSTALMPYTQIPGAFRIPVLVNPFTHVIDSLRTIVSGNLIDWNQFSLTLGLLVLLCILSFSLAIHCLKNDSK